tara:strand:+ start:236 stop:1258 length:1023 start_codon:yes stop_codon:yes gene_type:complete
MAIRSLGNSTSPYDAVMGQTGENTGVKDYDPPLVTGYGTRGLSGGGSDPGSSNVIAYITIANTGNATDFGDLTIARNALGACGGSGRGAFAGGWTGARRDEIDYVTVANTGNASSFGDLTVERSPYQASCSSGSRGVWMGGHGVPGPGDSTTNIIDYVTLANTGNATDFGDLTLERTSGGALCSTTRGCCLGGNPQTAPYPRTNIIDYITFDSTGNATDFGDMTKNAGSVIGNSNLTRGVYAVGEQHPPGSTQQGMEYITIASTGNATTFGDMVNRKANPHGMSSDINDRACWGGGYLISPGATTNAIEYVTISSTGNGTDFGDLTTNVYNGSGCAQGTG